MKSALIIADELGPILQEVLEKEGYDVSIVKSYGRLDEVYTELARKQYDLVIPTNNSFRPDHILELVPEIRKRHPKIRIIVLSGYHPPDFVSQLGQGGIDAFFPSPFEFNELVGKIKELLTLSKVSPRRMGLSSNGENQEPETVREEDVLFQAIGRFAVSFELMCDEMRECIAQALEQCGLSKPELAQIIVADLTADPLRRLLGAMFVTIWPKDAEGKRKVAELLKSIQDLIAMRNRILHGTWEIGSPYYTDDLTVAEGFKTRSSERRGLVREWMDFKAEDFDEYSDEAIRLKENVRIVRLDAFRDKRESNTVKWSEEFR